MTLVFRLLFGLIFIIISGNVLAHDNETLYNQIHLQAQAEKEIPNNQMIVLLAAEHEGDNAADLAKKINQDMQWALKVLKSHSFIESNTKNYQIHPVYKKQIIIGWRASQQIEIKSSNIHGLSDVVGQLQERLLVKHMAFSPTDDMRKKHEDELIDEAMNLFRHRVEIVSKHMDNKDYRIISVNINSAGGLPQPVYREQRAIMSMESTPAPAVEAGTSTISVTVNGSVQFF